MVAADQVPGGPLCICLRDIIVANSEARISTSKKKYLSAVDLFSGCGGLTLGLKQAGFRVLAAVEMDARAQATYKLNHPDVRLYCENIKRLSADSLLRDLGFKAGQLDLLAGCPPCQGFSRLRTRNKATSARDPRNNLIKDFLRFIGVFRPKTIMLENVPALLHDRRFKQLCVELMRLKYRFVARVLNAADYSVPQRRRRLILLASLIGDPEIAPQRTDHVTVRQALHGLETPTRTKDQLHGFPENRSKKVQSLIRLIPKNGGSRSDLPVRYQLGCHKRSDGFSDVYGRMAWDDVAPTLTSGCVNPSKGRFLHPQQNRTITLREAAVLQGFPRRYKFDISHGKEAIALMIGNALPPPFIAIHARSLRKCIVATSNGMKLRPRTCGAEKTA